MMSFSDINFAPLVPLPVLWGMIILAVLLCIVPIIQRKKGAVLRAIAVAFVILTVANPLLISAETEKLPNIVFVGKDISPSNTIENRNNITNALYDDVITRLQSIPSLSIQTFTIGNESANETRLFDVWSDVTQNTPVNQIAGTILVTDGNIHDSANKPALFDQAGPFHTLLSGREGEQDRRIIITNAPRYGMVGKDTSIEVQIIDEGGKNLSDVAQINVSDGASSLHQQIAPVGEKISFDVTLEHAGDNFFTFETPAIDGELTGLNNKTILNIQGVRDRLKVLLVSGLPHNGERVWRNLLKSDPNIDLVHFTILRSLENQDNVPVNELALIPFPIKELFVDKINDFDLIIFDRFSRFGLVPPSYINNIATFIENGGAFLDVSGPGLGAVPFMTTKLDQIMPAPQSPRVLKQAFTPSISDHGNRHPITRPFIGMQDDWGQWFRQLGVTGNKGKTLMSGIDNEPLLVVSHVGEGRIAQLTSDQIWLWARDYDTGGPHQELLRRLSHWLMKEPELEANRIETSVSGQDIKITAFFDATGENTLTVQSPSGITQDHSITFDETGTASLTIKAEEYGVYRFSIDDVTHAAIIGGLNDKEFERLTATDETVSTLNKTNKGRAFYFTGTKNDIQSPPVRMVNASSPTYGGASWLGLRDNNVEKTLSSRQTSLISPLLGLILAGGFMVFAWLRESR